MENIVEEWTHKGHRCKVVKTDIGHYCGYVQTGLRFNYEKASRLVDVHGGLTYGVDRNGWIGFDCAHVGDVCIDENGEKLAGGAVWERKTWKVEDVVEEVENLSRQISHLESFVEGLSMKVNSG